MEDWRSYDGVAATYERVHAPRFLEPARDLVAFLPVADGDRVLDVGTGTGVVAEAALAAGGRVVGIDPSLDMLGVARASRATIPVAAAEAIDLPFRDGSFDAVTAGFVLAHFTRPQTALFDLRRVLRPGARLGVSSWADGRDAFTDTWLELIQTIVPEGDARTLARRRDPAPRPVPPPRRARRDPARGRAAEDPRRAPRVRVDLPAGRVPRRARDLGDRSVREGHDRRHRVGGASANAPGRPSPTASRTPCTTAATCSWPPASGSEPDVAGAPQVRSSRRNGSACSTPSRAPSSAASFVSDSSK